MKKFSLKDKDINVCLASAGDDTADPVAVKAIRDAGNTITTCLAGLEDYLDEPLKGQFIKVKNDINTMLGKLPDTDKVPAAMRSNDMLRDLLWVMNTTQNMMTSLSDTVKSARTEVMTAKNSITGEVDKAINAKIAAGELVTKSDVQTKIDEATKAARTAYEAEQKTLSDRRTALNGLSLPLPADDKLTGKDEEFNARKDTAKARAEALKDFKVPADQLRTLCWDIDQVTFDTTKAVLEANKATAAECKTQKPNGFIAPAAAAGTINLRNTCC